MIGCDLTRIDPFTLSLLTNDEVIDIDQDPLGKGAACIVEEPDYEIWARPLADGSIAAGLYNTGLKERDIAFDLAAAGLAGKFDNVDECKPSDDGKRILVCASSCGFAVVDVATTNAVAAGCVNLPGKCANLHSICELPDGNLVVAGSQAGGLMIVDIKSKPFSGSSHVTTNAYRGAHGVLWDAKRNCLWATGEKPLTRFFYDPKTKTLKRDKSWNVEKPFSYLCGHDLVWGNKEHNRIASTLGNGIAVLDLESADKTDMMEISETLPGSVKGLSYAGGERLAVYLDKTAFKGMPWTTINIHVDGNGASRVYTLPGSAFYKAHFFLGSLAP
jgi:hypothetical protein